MFAVKLNRSHAVSVMLRHSKRKPARQIDNTKVKKPRCQFFGQGAHLHQVLRLLTQAEFVEQGTISVKLGSLEVIEQATALRDHPQQATASVVILAV